MIAVRESLSPVRRTILALCIALAPHAIASAAAVEDDVLQNPWGVAFFPGGPIWINANGSGTANLYDGAGTVISLLPFVNVPGPSTPNGAPTGIVANSNAFLFPIKSLSLQKRGQERIGLFRH